MRIGILLNCHGQGIAAALRALLPRAQVQDFLMQRVWASAEQREHVAGVLAQCDHVLTWRFGPRYQSLSTAALLRDCRSVHLVPPFHFRGFHPDTIRVSVDGANLGGPTGAYHSRILLAAYLAGLDAEAASGLFNRLVFTRLGYPAEFGRQAALLAGHLSAAGFDGPGLLAPLVAGGCFMHSFEHPKTAPLLALARALCVRLGLAMADGVTAESIEDTLVVAAIHPFFEDLAALLGRAPDGVFRGGLGPDGAAVAIPPAVFAQECFEVYARVQRAALAQADGVAAALAVLGFAALGSLAPQSPALGPQAPVSSTSARVA
jgi:hypothetical protein